ncbi:hypothetical protein ES703_20044 [subsurface metagenome]
MLAWIIRLQMGKTTNLQQGIILNHGHKQRDYHSTLVGSQTGYCSPAII